MKHYQHQSLIDSIQQNSCCYDWICLTNVRIWKLYNHANSKYMKDFHNFFIVTVSSVSERYNIFDGPEGSQNSIKRRGVDL